TVIQKSPAVKYRGIFINDEDWGLHPWSAKNYEKELGDIGPETYAQVCELLLRLKANMLAPAMHSCTGAFYSFPDSKVIADMYAIIITTSHCEPLLFNNAAKSEWDSKRDGEWNYATNKDRILKKLDDRVSEARLYENIYTMGMRGLHDEGMRGNQSKEEKVKILEKVISDQRNILTKYISHQVEEVPQIFVPYKETLDLYDAGLNVPDDITLVWTDDNYGYIKRLTNPEEQKRTGGSGVYYHYSYLGAPHDYLWLCTTAPVLMYMEMKKAYDTGADKYWLVNVGDIKPAELGMQTFFDFAWNIDEFDTNSINHHQSRFLAQIFGTQYQETFQNILDNYYRLAWERKPEYMGWERQWDRNKERGNLSDTDYSFQNYNNAQQRLADYKLISDIVSNIYNEIPQEYKPAFFELLSYPVMGSYQINRKFLMAQLSRERARESDFAGANWAAQEAVDAHETIEQLNTQYNTMLDGKWQGMMMLAPGWVSKYQNMPKVVHTQGVDAKPVDISVKKEKNKLEGCTVINLKNIKKKVATNGHTISIIDGIGYDWHAVQLGKATETKVDPENIDGTRLEYELPVIYADFVTVYVYTIPFFPIYKDRSNQFGISIDSQPVFVAENLPSEYSEPWKDQVLQNGTVAIAKFPIKNKTQKHTLTITCGDPGITIQRIIVDWGGLKKTYVGPGVGLLD
ncbi:MAG: glycosyl hydrolase 115 family protein, partial [Sedimentisphaerales bacterium]|nr:glycosyl hydrolase 115 family protein [Sedimentisphaerales bacterium]